MNSPERHFTRYMDHDWGDGTFGRDDRVLYTCDEEGPDGPLYDEHFRPISPPAEEGPIPPPTGPATLSYRRGEGLQSSWAIIEKGGVVFAEEPISHDLCDALLQMDNLIRAAIGVLRAEVAYRGECAPAGIYLAIANLVLVAAPAVIEEGADNG